MTDHYFLSYSRQDALEFAPRLAHAMRIQEPAHRLWLDHNDLRVGAADWDDQLENAICDSRGLLFVVSRDSVAHGSGCKHEWSLALQQGKPIIPILLHADAAIPVRLRSSQWVDFSNDFNDGIVRLRRDLDWRVSSEGMLSDARLRLAHAERRLARARPQEIPRLVQEIDEFKADIERLASTETSVPQTRPRGDIPALRQESRASALGAPRGNEVANSHRTVESAIVVANAMQRWNVAFVASPSLVEGPASPVAQLLREVEPCLKYLNVHMHVAQDALSTIIDSGLLRTLTPGHVHTLHEQAMLDVGAAVVGCPVVGLQGQFGENSHRIAALLGLDTVFDAVVYLVDPRDPGARLAETLAVKRACIARGRVFLATSASVREWFSLHAMVAAKESMAGPAVRLRRAFLDPDEADRIGLAPRGHQSVALIAHHYRKHALARYAVEHQPFLNSFAERIGTLTSAGILNQICQHGEACPASLEEMERLVDWVRQDPRTPRPRTGPEAAKGTRPDPWVTTLRSGSEGGDLQIAEAVRMGVCDTVVFFEDPAAPHESDIDAETIERAAGAWNLPERHLDGWGVTLLSDPKSADTWARLWMAQGGTPTTITLAFRARFGIEIVVVDPARGGDHAAWSAVAEEAAWYLLGALAAAGGSRSWRWHPGTGVAGQVRVVVPPGRGMYDVIQSLTMLADAPRRAAKECNDELDRALRSVVEIVSGDRNADPTIRRVKALLRSRRPVARATTSLISDVLIVAPATGTFGSPIRGIEANAHADELAAIFEARAISCAPSAFRAVSLKASPAEPATPFELHWAATDLLVLTCDAADEEYLSDYSQVPLPQGLGDHMKREGAVGHLAGLFVDGSGEPVEWYRYERCGVTAEMMREVAQAARDGVAGKDSVLIATQDSKGRRLETIKAVLAGGYASTLITDTATARALLDADNVR